MEYIAKVYQNDKHNSIPFSSPVLLSDFLIENEIVLPLNCGGKHTCGKCKVQVLGEQSKLSITEEKLLTSEEKSNHIRLACCTEIRGNCEIFVSEKPMQIQTNGYEKPMQNFQNQNGFGIAVDLGTTTVVASLYHLNNGQKVSMAAIENPQVVFGADVLSRMEKVLQGNNLISEKIQKGLLSLFEQLIRNAKIQKEDVNRIVIAGNTSMLSILTKQDVQSIVKPPFMPNELFGKMKKATEWNLDGFGEIPVWILPCISGYIGADTVASVCATEMSKSNGNCLLIDAGTNGEIVLKTNDSFYACSTAAGPAFEGVGLTCGMASKEGAISHVHIMNDDFQYEVIGNTSAQGICGSGMLDFLAIFVKIGVLDKQGIFKTSGHPFEEYMEQTEQQIVFRIPHTELIITQEDIRQIQMAKAAIASAILSLLKVANVQTQEIETIYLCGGFGTGLSVSSAQTIGMIPIHCPKIVAAGNASLAGAQQLLLQSELQCGMIKVTDNMKVIDLNNQENYMKMYIDNINF